MKKKKIKKINKEIKKLDYLIFKFEAELNYTREVFNIITK